MGGTPYNENAVTEASEEPTSRTKDGRHPRGRQRRAIGSDPEDLLGDGGGRRVVVRFGGPMADREKSRRRLQVARIVSGVGRRRRDAGSRSLRRERMVGGRGVGLFL